MQLEVIIQNGADAKAAEALGVDRLEFVSAIQEGGLTPSYGTIQQVLKSTSLPVFTMVRPHSNHFFYGEDEIEIIHTDIEKIVELGGDRIVTGALHKDRTINETFLQGIIEKWPDLTITFHRAFDETKDPLEAYRTLANYKDHVKYILTSGGAENCEEGAETLKKLVNLSKELDGPQIMPGAGLRPENIVDIHKIVQANYYHFGSAVRMDHSFANTYDEEAVKKIQSLLQR